MFPGENSLTLEEYMQQYCHRAPDHFMSTTRVSEDTNESSVTDKTEKEFVGGGELSSSKTQNFVYKETDSDN